MTRSRWMTMIGLLALSAGVYARVRARRKASTTAEPDALPIAGVMAMDVGITPVDPEPMHDHASGSRIP